MGKKGKKKGKDEKPDLGASVSTQNWWKYLTARASEDTMRGPKPFVNVYKSSAYADVESAASPNRPVGLTGREGPDVYDDKFAETLRGLLSGVGLNENREIQKAQFDTVTQWVDQYKPKGGSNSVKVRSHEQES